MSHFTICLILCFALLGCTARVENGVVEDRAAAGSININTATLDELEKLPHIGRKTAEAIIQFRTENGPFRRPEHIMQIRGISEELYIKLRPYLKTR